jgi:hypothetical protein
MNSSNKNASGGLATNFRLLFSLFDTLKNKKKCLKNSWQAFREIFLRLIYFSDVKKLICRRKIPAKPWQLFFICFSVYLAFQKMKKVREK